MDKENMKIGFIGLGVMGFSMCHGLYKSGYHIVMPSYRREIDQSGSFTPLVPDAAAKPLFMMKCWPMAANRQNHRQTSLPKVMSS